MECPVFPVHNLCSYSCFYFEMFYFDSLFGQRGGNINILCNEDEFKDHLALFFFKGTIILTSGV